MFSRNNKTVSELAPEKVHMLRTRRATCRARKFKYNGWTVRILLSRNLRATATPTVIRVAADGEATVVGGRSADGLATAGLLKVVGRAQAVKWRRQDMKAGLCPLHAYVGG